MTKIGKVTEAVCGQMQGYGEIGVVAGLDSGDKTSTFCLLGLAGKGSKGSASRPAGVGALPWPGGRGCGR
jgi:hypothetical protein